MSTEFPGITLSDSDITEIRERTLPSNISAINWLLSKASEEGDDNYQKRNAYLRPIRLLSNLKINLCDLTIEELKEINGVGDSISLGIYNLYHTSP